MTAMSLDQFLSHVRSILKVAGTCLAIYGFVGGGTWQKIVGIVLTIGGIIWSHYSHAPTPPVTTSPPTIAPKLTR
jgi:hypothetical protein